MIITLPYMAPEFQGTGLDQGIMELQLLVDLGLLVEHLGLLNNRHLGHSLDAQMRNLSAGYTPFFQPSLFFLCAFL